ncbi:MAG: radical SAM protein [Candidatus Omnitrophica bacterium]|nr:radical SAM protein [Candidatus Omnitrophota bacterium]MBU1870384.1 radical SAM protein [Candidatus Omnitrophota bacterium]
MKYRHALFLNPYIESKVNSTMKLFPPAGLEYVATSAKECAERVSLVDLRHEQELCTIEGLLDFIKNEGVDIICVGIGWDRQLKEIAKLLNEMPEEIPLIVGGYTATEKVEELFSSCPKIDIIVRGEGEETIKEILKGVAYENILGISYRKKGKVNHNPNRPLPEVDNIVPPERSLRRTDYHLMLNGINVTNISFDSVLSARGCPNNCKFCTFTINPLGQKRNYSARSPESVVDEIEKLPAKVILLSDDNFFAYPKRAEEICDLIIKRKLKKRFLAQSRIDIARYPQLLEKMVKAGFKALLIGIESPHDRILKQLNKGFTADTVRKAFSVLKKYPIYYHGYFIYGNITETEEEMLYIAEFAKEIGVDGITLNKLRIEKFSPLKELAEATPGYHVTERGELYSDTFSHADLKKIGRRLRFSFYTPSRFMKMLWKNIFVTKFFTLGEFSMFILAIPKLLVSVVARERARGRLGDSLKRTFISNA